MILKTSNGTEFIVDDDVDKTLQELSWYLFCGYVGTAGAMLLHNILLPPPTGFHVDHIDRNPLNNRISNLRIVTKSQNLFNRPTQVNNTSGFKGVSFNYKNRKFISQIRVKGNLIYLGSFETGVEAAVAYNKAAIELVGEVAYLNPI